MTIASDLHITPELINEFFFDQDIAPHLRWVQADTGLPSLARETYGEWVEWLVTTMGFPFDDALESVVEMVLSDERQRATGGSILMLYGKRARAKRERERRDHATA